MVDLLNKPTSPYDLFNIAEKSCNVFTYPEITKFKKYKDLFKKGNSEYPLQVPYPFDDRFCIILYLTGDRCGHWTCVSYNKSGINFLDSYGDVVDDQLKHVDMNIIGQHKKHLINILAASGLPIRYNDMRLQKLSNNIATCGRYCALYLKYNYMTVEDFVNVLRKKSIEYKMTPDELVCKLTA